MKTEVLRVSRIFHFDMAHALYGYDGPCKNIHGHSYKLTVTLSGSPLEKNDHPKNGMVLDFSVMKKIVKQEVLDHFDHALLLNSETPHAKIVGLDKQFEKIVLLPFQPTCENLLLEIKNRLIDEFEPELKLVYVRLDETASSYAEWFAADN